MNPRLALRDIRTYRRDGYLVLPGLFSPAELGELSVAVEEALQRLGCQQIAGNPDLHEAPDFQPRINLQRVNLWKIHGTVRRYLLDPGLGRALCALAGVAGIRVWHDQAFFKPPWANPTAFHVDLPNWSFFSERALQIWIPFDSATTSNGCLHYLPGSHRLVSVERNARLGDDVGAFFKLYPELAGREAVAVELAAGDAVVHNGLVVHAAGANMTPHWRRAMTCQYMPVGSTFNGNRSILSSAQRAALHVGDPLDDPAHFPAVWPA